MTFLETTAIQDASAFLLQQWQARSHETGRPIPTNLDGACKFASLFAAAWFGGELQGNYNHQFVRLDGAVLDLTGTHHPVAWYRHDRRFWLNPEHQASLESCKPRVKRWLRLYEQIAKKPLASGESV